MELFNNDKELFLSYIEQPLLNKDVELELIFGSSPQKNPIHKKVFLSLINQCKENYTLVDESTSLDIRCEYKNNVSNIRCSIHGLDSIKKYCKTDSLEDIIDLEFIQKQYYKNKEDSSKKYLSLKDYDYNVRLNIKTEKSLNKDHHFVTSFLSNFGEKKKHFRYKKRLSFLTIDKLFRIDITVIKNTKFTKGRHDFQKTFRRANVLRNPEQYEVEIEYIGWKKEVGIEEVDRLYNHFNENYISLPGKEISSNIYDPLNMGIHIFEKEEKEKEKEKEEEEINYNYEFDSPRYTDDSIVEDSEEVKQYEDLIGKYVKIKDKYFIENEIDPRLMNSLKEYYKRGIYFGIVKEVYHYKKGIEALVMFNEPIGDIPFLIVPVKQLYNTPNFTPLQSALLDDDDDSPEEIILPSKIPGQEERILVINELTKKVAEILENHVIDITKRIYRTDQLISFQLRERVIEKYRKITGQRNKRFIFMGPQPVTLMMDHLKKNNPHSILEDYAVTEKADGERYQMMIMNHKGYLINSKQNVIDMNITFENYQDGWLFDGEYITQDKDHKPIQLFMIFDIYLDEEKKGEKIIPQPVHTYPFISRNEGDISRSSILQNFYNTMKIKEHSSPKEWWEDIDKKSIRIDLKQYEFGYLSNPTESQLFIKKKTKFSEDITGIFKASERILKREEEGYYPYRIDGLIYLPIYYSVKGSTEGVQSKFINGTWDYNFKWKPPEENTIDFLVKVRKTVINAEILDQIIPSVSIDNGISSVHQYKQLELYVGYDEGKDDSINYCMKVLEEGRKVEEGDKIKRFNHTSKEEEKYDTTNILLDNGKMLCMNYEKDEVRDGDLVEMRFNPQAKNACYWEPLRIRTDKIDPQFFTIASNVWKTIQNPITGEMIRGKYNIDELIKEEEEEKGKYYVSDSESQLLESNRLRKLHNFIKTKLIHGVCSSFKKPIKIMDLSFGQGGDTQKYINDDFQCSLLMGIDISSNIDEACKRFYEVEKRNHTKTNGVFFRADTSKNIENKECTDIEGIAEEERKHSETMIDILYGNNRPIPKEYQHISRKYKSLAKSGFDVISSQFSMHYYFETEETFYGFLENLKENIRVGGYFIGTCYDGNKIFNYFKNKNDVMRRIWYGEDIEDADDTDDEEDQYSEYDYFEFKDHLQNKVFSIKKKYEMDDFLYDPEANENMFGNKIEVFMDSIGQPIDEFLVNFDFFIHVMKENGFKLVIPNEKTNIFRKEYFENGLGQFGKVIENLPEIRRTDKVFQRFYSEAYEMNIEYNPESPLSILSSFNNYFIFQRV